MRKRVVDGNGVELLEAELFFYGEGSERDDILRESHAHRSTKFWLKGMHGTVTIELDPERNLDLLTSNETRTRAGLVLPEINAKSRRRRER